VSFASDLPLAAGRLLFGEEFGRCVFFGRCCFITDVERRRAASRDTGASFDTRKRRRHHCKGASRSDGDEKDQGNHGPGGNHPQARNSIVDGLLLCGWCVSARNKAGGMSVAKKVRPIDAGRLMEHQHRSFAGWVVDKRKQDLPPSLRPCSSGRG